MTNDGNANQNPWPGQPQQQPYGQGGQPPQQGQQPYGQQPQTGQASGQQASGQPPYGRQPSAPPQPYGQQANAPQQPYGQQPNAPQQPYGQQPQPHGQQPYGQQPYGSAGQYAAPGPKRSLREPLVGGLAVVAFVILLSVFGVIRNLTYGPGALDSFVGTSFLYSIVPIVFAGLAFVSAAFISPIEPATTRAAFLKSAAIAIGIGAAGLFIVSVLFSLGDGDRFLQSFLAGSVLGTIQSALNYGAIFVAAILIDRLGRRSR